MSGTKFGGLTYYVYTVTKVGAKNSIMSIVSIVSTQVAPRLHHLYKKEGQLDIFIIKLFYVYSSFSHFSHCKK